MASSAFDRRRPVVAALVVVLLGASPRSRAQSDEPAPKRQAEAELEQGMTLLKQHHYAEALARFKDAYALIPSPLILYDFGLAQLGLGDEPEALQSFEDFLKNAPGAPEDKRRRAAQYLDDLRRRVAVVTLNADVPTASVSLDGRDIGRIDLPRRFYVSPGPHELVARAGEVTRTTTVTSVVGEAQTVSITLAQPALPAPIPVAPIPTAPHEKANPPPAASLLSESIPATGPSHSQSDATGHRARTWALAAAAAGAVSLGAGLTFGVLASNQADSVTADAQSRRDFVPADEASGLRDQRLEIVFLSIGAAAVLTGLGIYAFLRHHEASSGAGSGAP